MQPDESPKVLATLAQTARNPGASSLASGQMEKRGAHALIGFDQVFALIGALLAFAVIGLVPGVDSSLWPGVAAFCGFVVVGILTAHRVEVTAREFRYVTVFHVHTLPLSSIARISGEREWTVIPLAAQWVFVLTGGSVRPHGGLFRVGLFTVSSAETWARSASQALGQR